MNSLCIFPIPISNEIEDTGNYRTIPVNWDHPSFKEQLVDVRHYGLAGESYYAKTDGENAPYFSAIQGALPALWVRKGVAERLVRARNLLATQGLELFLVDGFRPLDCQKGIWDFFWNKIKAETNLNAPDALRKEVSRYVSDPDLFDENDPLTWPTHITGGSVDVLLRSKATGQLVDMGAGFDEMSPVSHTAFFEERLAAKEICHRDPRLMNRRALYSAMAAVGFTNYANEYWHFDFGNQLHEYTRSKYQGRHLGRPARYGCAALPTQ